MTKMRKFATALVLGLVMCLALFATGAFAQNAHRGHWNHVAVSATAIAIAGGDNFWNDFGGCGFGGFGGFGGCWNPCGDFFGNGAFAHASVHILGGGWF